MARLAIITVLIWGLVAAAPAAASASPMRRQTGSATETWATQPVPKKLLTRAKVRSMN